jgi:hypothetical protein
MSWRSICCLIVASTTFLPCAFGQGESGRVRGANVAIELVSARRTVLRGELIAVSLDSVWVLGRSGLDAAPLGYVRRASVKQHSLDAQAGLIWTLVGGLVTGGLLTAACASVEEGCFVVFPVTLGAWGIVGGLSALTLEYSSRRRFVTPNIGNKIRGYARFPHGLPAGLDRNTLGLQLTLRAPVPPLFR